MTAPTLNETATVRDLLFGDRPSQPTDEIADSLRQHGTVRGLVPGVARPQRPSGSAKWPGATDGTFR